MTVAGDGIRGFSGDGGLAVIAQVYSPRGVYAEIGGLLLIADTYNHRVRMVNSAGMISTIAGMGSYGFSGDGQSAMTAKLAFPSAV